jgi:hypothetical protein
MSIPTGVAGQTPHTRDGFWAQLGLGYGSLGCQDCDSRDGGGSGSLSLGGTLSERWLLGGSINAWTKSKDGATLTVGTVTALARFYPSPAGGFFLQGGLGYGTVEVSGEGDGFSVSVSQSGAGAVLGAGWDLRVATNLSLTPYLNFYAIATDDTDANVLQGGLALTIH